MWMTSSHQPYSQRVAVSTWELTDSRWHFTHCNWGLWQCALKHQKIFGDCIATEEEVTNTVRLRPSSSSQPLGEPSQADTTWHESTATTDINNNNWRNTIFPCYSEKCDCWTLSNLFFFLITAIDTRSYWSANWLIARGVRAAGHTDRTLYLCTYTPIWISSGKIWSPPVHCISKPGLGEFSILCLPCLTLEFIICYMKSSLNKIKSSDFSSARF